MPDFFCGVIQFISHNRCLLQLAGTEHESLAKLIFMELSDAYSEFENDPTQQQLFKQEGIEPLRKIPASNSCLTLSCPQSHLKDARNNAIHTFHQSPRGHHGVKQQGEEGHDASNKRDTTNVFTCKIKHFVGITQVNEFIYLPVTKGVILMVKCMDFLWISY